MKEFKYCECGCGQIVKNRFIKGHSWKNKKHKPESIEKMKESSKGHVAWNKGLKSLQVNWNKGLPKEQQPFYNHRHTEKTKIAIGLANKDRSFSKEVREKLNIEKRNIPLTEEHKANLRKGAENRPAQSEETKKKRSETLMNHPVKEETRKKIRENRKGKGCGDKNGMKNPGVIEKCRLLGKERWKNPEYIKKVRDSSHIRPNKPESIILNLLDTLFPNEWKYTGDFSFWINGKNPDFVNINGQKKIIEFFGDYYHRGENEQDRINIFKEYGWNTLIIWEHELKDIKMVTSNIIKFHQIISG